MPIHVNELDDDSEEELDPEWMHSKMEMASTYYSIVNVCHLLMATLLAL